VQSCSRANLDRQGQNLFQTNRFNCYLCLMSKALNRILATLLSFPVHFYRYAISPLLSPSCRHVPSCSQYALDALKIHGPLKGSFLTINRILRCRPGGTHGYDPVPLYWFKKYRILTYYKNCSRLKH
jgi:putative membrane protein insertion efficiency factor